jgi:hypothetical protein
VSDLPSADDLVAAFGVWAADERAKDAATARSRRRWLEEEARASATFTGLLVDMAESEAPVVLGVGTERLSGRVMGVGLDFLVLEAAGGNPALVVLNAVSAIWPSPESKPSVATGDREPTLELSLAAALSLMAEQRLPVSLMLSGGHEVAGDLVAVGEDVLTVQISRQPKRLASAPLASLALCELR